MRLFESSLVNDLIRLSFAITNDNQIKSLTEDLSSALIELELSQFELELAKEQTEQ